MFNLLMNVVILVDQKWSMNLSMRNASLGCRKFKNIDASSG